MCHKGLLAACEQDQDGTSSALIRPRSPESSKSDFYFRPREKQLALKPVEGYIRFRPRSSMKTTEPRNPVNVATKSYLVSLHDVTLFLPQSNNMLLPAFHVQVLK
jgi:hypothetical protein